MPVTVEWDNEDKTIIRVTMGEYTWDDIESSSRQEQEMLDGINHKVDFIVDITSTKIPKDVLANFQKFAAAPPYTHTNAGLVVIVGANRFHATITEIFGKVHKPLADKLAMASTVEEAYEIITQYRRLRSGV